MAQVQYVGPFDEVRVPLPLGGEAVVSQGDKLDTSDAHAASLAEQARNWKLVGKSPVAPVPAPAPVAAASDAKSANDDNKDSD